MNKRDLLKKFEARIAADFSVLTQAALAAREAAIHSESKAEDQYDTRGLEASYLAGAQSKRALELEGLLALFRHIDLKQFGPQTPIAATAVIELESECKRSLLFSDAPGRRDERELSTESSSRSSHPITLGKSLLGRRVGEQIEVEIQASLATTISSPSFNNPLEIFFRNFRTSATICCRLVARKGMIALNLDILRRKSLPETTGHLHRQVGILFSMDDENPFGPARIVLSQRQRVETSLDL